MSSVAMVRRETERGRERREREEREYHEAQCRAVMRRLEDMRTGDVEELRRILGRHRDSIGDTTLHWAARFGYREGYNEVAKLLVEKGADPNAKGFCGWTASRGAMPRGRGYSDSSVATLRGTPSGGSGVSGGSGNCVRLPIEL